MMSKSIRELLEVGTQYLLARGVDEARANMQSLVCKVLNCNKTSLYLRHEEHVYEPELTALRDLLRERGKGVPLQHLLGSVEFYRREFLSDGRALIPRPETEELVEFALARVQPKKGMRILDMGTGSGVIGVSLALELATFEPETVLVDVSEAALSLALDNATRLGARVKTYRSNLFELWQSSQLEGSSAICPPVGYDLVLANLPYVPEGEQVSAEVSHDPATALYGGADGLDVVRRFLDELRPHLASSALVLLEVGHDQGAACCELMRDLGYEGVDLLVDMSGKARFPLAYGVEKAQPVASEPVAQRSQTEHADG